MVGTADFTFCVVFDTRMKKKKVPSNGLNCSHISHIVKRWCETLACCVFACFGLRDSWPSRTSLAGLGQARPWFCQSWDWQCPLAILHTFFRSGTSGTRSLWHWFATNRSQREALLPCVSSRRQVTRVGLPACRGVEESVLHVQTGVMEDWRTVPSLRRGDSQWGGCLCVYPHDKLPSVF